MIKDSVHEGDVTILNMNVSNNGNSTVKCKFRVRCKKVI